MRFVPPPPYVIVCCCFCICDNAERRLFQTMLRGAVDSTPNIAEFHIEHLSWFCDQFVPFLTIFGEFDSSNFQFKPHDSLLCEVQHNDNFFRIFDGQISIEVRRLFTFTILFKRVVA